MKNVLVFGHVCIDRNITENATYESAGSPAMFIAKILRQLPDCRLTVVAPYGQDFLQFSQTVVLYPDSPMAINTMRYENTISRGIRRQRCFNWEQARPIPLNASLRSLIKRTDIVCIAPLAPNIPPDYVSMIKRTADKHTKLVLLPQGYYRQFGQNNDVYEREFTEAESILADVDVVIVSDEDHRDMLHIAEQWSSRHSVIVIVTQAEEGATIFMNSQSVHMPAISVPKKDIVSSVGAGDIFAAGFIFQYPQADTESSVRFGNALAAQCLRYKPDEITIDVSELP